MTAEQVKALRDELGCSLGELAAAVGVDTRTVLAWEAGDEFPTKRHVSKLEKLRSSGMPARGARGAPRTPFEALADARLWKIVRKLLSHPELLREVERLSERYDDPAKGA